ncbi:MAG: TIGR01244 family sulfur transferase [Halioglobus sp.]
MKIVKLAEFIAVSPQIAPHNMAEIAAAGYLVVINNRPDGEAPDQPGSADLAAAAQAAGLEYHYMPVTPGNFPGPDFARMCALLDDTRRPILAFCRTGTRCANLWVASQDPESREQAQVQARQSGYDLTMSSAKA